VAHSSHFHQQTHHFHLFGTNPDGWQCYVISEYLFSADVFNVCSQNKLAPAASRVGAKTPSQTSWQAVVEHACVYVRRCLLVAEISQGIQFVRTASSIAVAAML
jgi:hypothetical protein